MSKIDEFEVVLRRRGDLVIAGIPQLALFAKGKDIQTAMDALDLKKKQLSDALLDVGELDRYDVRASVPAVMIGGGTSLWQFLARTAIVGVVILLAISASTAFIASQADFNIVKSIDKGLAKAADPRNDLSPERKARMLENLKIVIDRWRPTVDEAGRLLTTGPTSGSTGQAPN